MISATNIILYVSNQEKSTAFYQSVLEIEPALNVPGMTEFKLADRTTLGLMPEKGIKSLLGDVLPDPCSDRPIPRAELYLTVDNPDKYHNRAISFGAKELSPLKARGWGDSAAYSMDFDGHILVFAKKSE